MALHSHLNHDDPNYQRFIRIFSLQIMEQPITINMKHMFTFNYGLLKSVGFETLLLVRDFYAI